MKKLPIIIAIVVLLIIASLPIFGNKFMQNYIQDEITLLSSHGIKVKNVKTESGYLQTKKHFVFTVEDASDFLKLLNHYATYQVPPQTNGMLKGTLVGLDIAYSNLPFAKSVDFDIYPLATSPQITNELKTEDINFYNQLDSFLKTKGLLCHLEYNLINSDFKGFFKDINQEYALQNKSHIEVKLTGATFKGNGDLFSPTALSSKVVAMHFKATGGKTVMIANIKNFSEINKFTSYSKYKTKAKLKELNLEIHGNDDVKILVKDLKTDSFSTVKADKVLISSNSSIKNLEFDSKKITIAIKDFKSNAEVENLDKASFESLSQLLAQADSLHSLAIQKDIQLRLTQLFSKGLKIKIKELSLKDLTLNHSEELGGFYVTTNIVVKKDANLAKKLQISPTLLVSNIAVKSKINLSKLIYQKLLATSPMASIIQVYAKEDKDNVNFDIDFNAGKLSINGKVIQ